MRRFCLTLLCIIVLLSGSRLMAQEMPQDVNAYELTWSPDGRWIGVGSSDGVWIFDVADPEADPVQYAAGTYVYKVAFDPQRPHVALASEEMAGVVVFNLETQAEVYRVSIHPSSAFYDLTYSDEGRTLSGLNVSMLYVLDAATGQKIFEQDPNSDNWNNFNAWLTSLDYGFNDTAIVASTWGGDLFVYNVRDPRRTITYRPELEGGIQIVRFVPGGNKIVLLAIGLHVYDTRRKTVVDLELSDTRITGFDISADGTQLAAGTELAWVLYDLEAGEVTQTFTSPARNTDTEGDIPVIYSLAFHPEGDQVATLQTDGLIRIWDTRSGDIISEWHIFDRGFSQRWG